MNKKVFFSSVSFLAMFLSAQAQEMVATTSMLGDTDPNGIVSSCVTVSTNLRYKMRDIVGQDGDVNTLQDFLISGGFMQGDSTGYFGAGTLRAVKMFQQRQGLSPTGYVGQLTREKIKTVSCDTTNNTTDRQVPSTSEMNRGVQNPAEMQGGDRHGSKEQKGLSQMILPLLSQEDKDSLKKNEDTLKIARDTVKTVYDKIKSGDTSDSTKQELQKDLDILKTTETSMMTMRKAIIDKVKSSLSVDQQKKLDEAMSKMKPTMNASGTMQMPPKREREGERQEQRQGRFDKKGIEPLLPMKKYIDDMIHGTSTSVRPPRVGDDGDRRMLPPPETTMPITPNPLNTREVR